MAKSTKRDYNNLKFKPPQSKGLFTVTDPENMKPYETKNIQINKLVSFKNHPFKPYEGQRLEDMRVSVKESGILLPIIVRPIDDDHYEILSGHNRMKAAESVGLEFIPAIIRENLSDDEALLIVTETNLIQRSFTDLSYSEKAIVLKNHMDAIKSQGKRIDLINEINLLLSADEIVENGDLGLIDPNLTTRDKTAEKYNLDARSVSRYIRLNELNKPLLNRVDNEEIGLYAAVSISYLLPDEQEILNDILDQNKACSIDMNKAELLRQSSKNKKLTKERIIQILTGKLNKKIKSKKSYTIKNKTFSKYFNDDMERAQIDLIIDEALEEYFAKKKHPPVRLAGE